MATPAIDEEAAMRVITAAQKPSNPRQFVAEFKAKMWVENDWLALLASAPVCIEMLGSCSLAASTDIAQTVTLTPPAGGFKHLKGYKYLNSSLVEVTNRGRLAFGGARSRMATIQRNSVGAKRHIGNIFAALRAPDYDQTVTTIEMTVLVRIANQCKQDAMAMKDDFDDWLKFIMELHEACADQESNTQKLFRDAKSKEDAKKFLEAAHAQSLGEQKERVKKMEVKMEEHNKRYKELLDKFPTGDDLMKQQLIMMLAETVGSVLKTGASAAAVYVSPASALSIFNKPEPEKETSSGGSAARRTPAAPAAKKASDEDDDPSALMHCPILLRALEALDEIVRGSDGVDWDLVAGNTPKAGAAGAKKPRGKLNLTVIETMVSSTRKAIRKAPDERASKAGKALLDVTKKATKVIEELEAEGVKARDIKAWKKPEKDSAAVKGWQSAVKDVLKATRKLSAKAKASGDAPANTTLILPDDPAAKEKVQARTDLNSATIEAAQSALQAALDGYVATQETARKMGEKTVEIQNNLAQLRTEIFELGNEQQTLESIRLVLRDCITYLLQLKANVDRLIRFFDTVATIVSSAVDYDITPFVDYAKAADQTRAKGELFKRSMLETLFKYALTSAAYFEFFADIAGIYIAVNDGFITHGLDLVDRLGTHSTASTLETKKGELRRYAAVAETGIKTLIQEKTDTVMSTIDTRAAELTKLLGDGALPPLPSDQRAAIREGTQEAAKASAAAIDENNAALVLLGQPREVREAANEELAAAVDDEAQLAREAERIKEAEVARKKREADEYYEYS